MKLGQPKSSVKEKPVEAMFVQKGNLLVSAKVNSSAERRRAWLEVSVGLLKESKRMVDPVLRDVWLRASGIAREWADTHLENAAHSLVSERGRSFDSVDD